MPDFKWVESLSPLQRDDFYRVEVSLSKEGEGEERARRRRQRKSLRRKNLRSRISIVCVLVVFGSSVSLVRQTITVPVRKWNTCKPKESKGKRPESLSFPQARFYSPSSRRRGWCRRSVMHRSKPKTTSLWMVSLLTVLQLLFHLLQLLYFKTYT